MINRWDRRDGRRQAAWEAGGNHGSVGTRVLIRKRDSIDGRQQGPLVGGRRLASARTGALNDAQTGGGGPGGERGGVWRSIRWESITGDSDSRTMVERRAPVCIKTSAAHRTVADKVSRMPSVDAATRSSRGRPSQRGEGHALMQTPPPPGRTAGERGSRFARPKPATPRP